MPVVIKMYSVKTKDTLLDWHVNRHDIITTLHAMMDNLKGGYKLTLEDGKGGWTDWFCYEDLILPRAYPDWFDPREKLQSIRQFQYREGDVLICSYPKSGNHWLTNLLTLILSKDPVESTSSVNVNLIDMANPTERLHTKTSPRIITSHLKFDRLPQEHFQRGGKVILLVRNPKDVAVSYFYHLTKDPGLECMLPWDNYLKYFCEGKVLFGSYFDYLRDWEKVLQNHRSLNILLVYFEDLKEKKLMELQRIQRYLGINNSEERLKTIADRCSLSSLKSDVETGKIRTLLKDKENIPFVYRKGEIGDWRNHFTISQNEDFEKIIRDELKDSIFQFQYKSEVPKHRL